MLISVVHFHLYSPTKESELKVTMKVSCVLEKSKKKTNKQTNKNNNNNNNNNREMLGKGDWGQLKHGTRCNSTAHA